MPLLAQSKDGVSAYPAESGAGKLSKLFKASGILKALKAYLVCTIAPRNNPNAPLRVT
jgi:hypothetical protein